METGMTKQTCTTCGVEKPVGDFYPKSRKCKVCTLARQKALKAEKAGKPISTPSKKKAAAEPEPVAEEFRLYAQPSLGYDVNYDGTDFVLTQVNAEVTSTIWLSPADLRAIFEFGERLAKRAAGQA
jgi:hypothetical protein